MRYNIVFSPESSESFEMIAEYLARQSPDLPKLVLSPIKEKIMLLETLPRLGKTVETRPALRRIIVGSYQVYYEINEVEKQIGIVDIIHSAHQSALSRIRGGR